ncbi:glycosyltransferase family 4 protein [Aureitalea sp. L0-47]|uniref:glycosyltransferase family 4 protein n=1 Tax=Aureitalea sp. L0-47 TaxID=2816962 RepID=UPI002238F990|nr:glycosyltransferase family 4 protein [Aureitalea sp. L0-47]MCW5519163.1 glycosyltransferase family 4 protein [Aureitalea sp. L0-47]
MDKRRIVYLGNKASAFGGTVTTMETLIGLLRSEGFEVVSASSKRNKIMRLLDMIFTFFRNTSRDSVVLIDTYSTQNFYYAVTIGNLCRLLRIPYIPILHGGNLPERLVKSRNASWKLFNGAEINVAPSQYLMEKFKAEGYNNLTHIPNVIDLQQYPFKNRTRLEPKLLWVRSFSQIYNPELAIELVQHLIQNGIKAELCMVGPDKDGTLQKCKTIAADRNLPVTFTGKLEKQEWIDLAVDYDIFINTTNFDNMPVSVIEAMALGLPVVTTNVGGIPYLAKHDENAMLVEPNNVELFYKAILDLLNNPAKAEELSKKARSLVENFDWEVVKHSWLKLLKA